MGYSLVEGREATVPRGEVGRGVGGGTSPEGLQSGTGTGWRLGAVEGAVEGVGASSPEEAKRGTSRRGGGGEGGRCIPQELGGEGGLGGGDGWEGMGGGDGGASKRSLLRPPTWLGIWIHTHSIMHISTF
jgi:hypothetical protein